MIFPVWKLESLRSRFLQGFCESSLPGLQIATFSVCLHMAENKGSKLFGIFSYKGTNPVMRAPPWQPYPFPNTITLGIRKLGLQHISGGWNAVQSVASSSSSPCTFQVGHNLSFCLFFFLVFIIRKYNVHTEQCSKKKKRDVIP